MTFTIEKEYVYFAVTMIVLLLQLYNTWRISRIKSEIETIWNQISLMAITAGSAFDKIEKRIDEKQDK